MKKMIPWILATAVIMLVFPWLAVTFIKGDGGMAVCFILFFAVNPIYAICSGAYAGKDIKIFWTLPIIIALFFLLGTWLFFSMGEKAFILYALRNLKERPWRFNELQRSIDGISQKVLTDSLRQMMSDGLAYRHDYHEQPPRVEYGLTELGTKMLPIVNSLADFGNYYKSIIEQN